MSCEWNLTSPEAIEAEKFMLLSIQDHHGLDLERIGTYDKAIVASDTGTFTDLTRASVVMLADRTADDIENDRIDIPTIRLTTPSIDRFGNHTASYKHVPVARVHGEAINLQGDFTIVEAAMVMNMLAGLRQTKALGILPHLSYDLGEINDPRTYMMRLPKVSS